MLEKKPSVVYILFFLLIIMGLMAIAGGGLLSIKPDGSLMKIPISDLAHTPFSNYLIPGLLLLIMIGILPIFLSYAMLARPNSTILSKLNMYRDMQWYWSWIIYYGQILVLWIIIEISMVGYHTFVQSIVAIWGVVIITLALMPSVRDYFASTNK